MRKVKSFKSWNIYEATNDNDRISFENSNYAAFLPEQSPREFYTPEWCADSINELIDFIRSY